jgi:hypothetical protein
MENDKVKLDEKTARNIEEMEKSLRNLEQAMGPDHMVVAKILDSYAKLLRQNNIRHLDALNMEARAKHIRAKNNQQEEKAQMEGLADLKPRKKSSMSVAEARILVWCLAGVVTCVIGYGAFEVIKSSTKNIKAISHKYRKSGDEDRSYVVDKDGKTVEATNDAMESGPAAPTTINRNTEGPVTQEAPEQVRRETSSSSSSESSSGESQGQGMTVLEFAKKALEVKSFAKSRVAEAMELERNKDFPAAAQAYFSVITTAQQVSAQLGRPIYSESIAKAFEGYGRMAELDNHSDIAQQSEKAAADVRAHLSGSDD